MTHPDADLLQRLLADRLTPDERDAIAAHVDDCDACLERLDGLQRPGRSDLRLLAGLLLEPPAEVAETPPTAPYQGPPGQTGDWPQFAAYETLAYVGRGGMGEVYRARHRATNRVVALKTLPPGPDRAERLARFRTECEAVSRLQHPGIVAVYDVGERDGVPYFTMEWVEGGSLADWLSGRPQPERLAADWIAQLAEAVEQVHRRQIVHRDLKPANVLLAFSREPPASAEVKGASALAGGSRLNETVVKLTDFGIAKLLDRPGLLTQPAQRVGTPEYMAPEQAAGDPEHVGPACDVYALGAILYEMLTGRPPFRADDPLETLRQVRDEEPLPPRRLRPRLARDLETVCLKCLRKEPRQRYGTAQELADDLRRFLAGEPIRARPAGLWERLVKWARRRPERAALALLGLLLFAGLAANYFGQPWAENARRARQLADAADTQLLLVKYAVGQTARDDKLRRLLRGRPPDRAALGTFMATTRDDFRRWFTRPGETPPIINWFVLDRDGVIVADSDPDRRRSRVGQNYGFRDYAARLLGPDAPAEGDVVHVSRLYESEQDGRFKFTVVARVWDAEEVRGALAASLAVDARMVALDMRREADGAAVVGRMDDRVRPGEPPRRGAAHVVVLHRDYATGQAPFPAGYETVFDAFEENADRSEAAVPLGPGGSFAHFARVGDTEFVAVVERPWPAPVGLLLRWPLPSAGVVAAAAAVAAVLRWRLLRTSP